MKKLLILLVLLACVSLGYGQFRGASWGMTVSEVTEKEDISPSEAQYYDFRNGNQSLGFKSEMDFGEAKSLVYRNYHFIHNRLKSGSYVFYELDNNKIDQLIDQVSGQYGNYDIFYGNQKLKRTVKASKNTDYKKLIEQQYSLELIWKDHKETKVVLRIITTGTDLFGTWGWLSFYEKDYYRKSVETSAIRTMTGEL